MFDKCIYFNLITLMRRVNRIWQKEFKRLGLTPSHGYLLFAMKELPDATQKDLSELMELDASNITRLIEGLENQGLVKKTTRGKGSRFTVTSEGRKAYRTVQKVMDSLYGSMQERFGPEHFKSFVSDLHEAKKVVEEN